MTTTGSAVLYHGHTSGTPDTNETEAHMQENTDYSPREAADVTDEIIEMAYGYCDAPMGGHMLSWEEVWDRTDGARLDNGQRLDWGNSLDTPAMRKVQREVRRLLKERGVR